MRYSRVIGLLLVLVAISSRAETPHEGTVGHESVPYASYCHMIRSESPSARENPLVVVIPGGPGLGADTIASFKGLSSHSDVCLLDPPGVGKGQPLPDYNYNAIITDIEDAIRAQGRSVVLVGHSMGGIFAAELVARGKLPVEGVTLIASPLSPASFADTMKNIVNMEEKIFGKEVDLSHIQLQDLFAKGSDYYFSPGKVEQGKSFISKAAMNDELLAIVPGVDESIKTLWDRFKKCPVPKLIISAEGDRVVLSEQIARDAKESSIPHVQIRGVGHFPGFEKPEEVNGAIRLAFFDHPTGRFQLATDRTRAPSRPSNTSQTATASQKNE